MNPLNNINLTVFETSAGHHGKHTWKWILSRFEQLYGLNNFGKRTLALRIHNGNEEIAAEIIKEFPNFEILKELSDKQIANNPHEKEFDYANYIINNYCHSIANVFTLVPIKTEFILFQEADRTMEFNGNYQELLITTLDKLRQENDIFCVRIGGPDDDIPVGKENELFLDSPFCFHPFIVKSEKMYNVAQCFKDNYLRLQNMHPEMLYQNIIQHVYPGAKFIRFNPKIGYNLNLGQRDYLEVIQKYNLGFK